MPQESKSVYALLGLLSFGSMSGYDIKKWIDEGLGYFWSLSYGQIYPTLNELNENGLVTFVLERQGKRPERKTYTITEKGTKVLRDWLYKPLCFSDSNNNEMLLKLFFGAQIPAGSILGHIEQYEQHNISILNGLHRIEELVKADPDEDKSKPFRLIAISHGILACESHILWCKRARETLKTLS